MKTFHTRHRVAHSANDMFALVADVERYPEFVPLCQALTLRKYERAGDKDVLTVDMTVAYKMFHETFASRVTLDPAASQILVEYLDGPFRHLENRWHFAPIGERACEVDFYIAYELASRTLQMVLGAMFDQAFRKFADAFEARADEIYGTAPASA